MLIVREIKDTLLNNPLTKEQKLSPTPPSFDTRLLHQKMGMLTQKLLEKLADHLSFQVPSVSAPPSMRFIVVEHLSFSNTFAIKYGCFFEEFPSS